jgi:hypothetical protein
MFLAPPVLSTTDAYACFGVQAPAVLTAPDGAVLAVGAARPVAALELIRADAAEFRLRWFAYTHPAHPGDPVTRPAAPGEDGAFPVMVWRAVDQAAARFATGTRTAVTAMAVAA